MNHGFSVLQEISDFKLNLLKVLNSLSFIYRIIFLKDFFTINSHINRPLRKCVQIRAFFRNSSLIFSKYFR